MPTVLYTLLKGPDPAKAARAMQAMLQMTKLDIAGLQRAWGRAAALAGGLLFALASADIAWTMLRMHPHQYVYFNRLIGGLGGAVGNYDTDYYGQSYKEAVEGMHRFLWRTERRQYMNTIYTFSACMSNWAVARHAPPNLRGHRQKTGPGPDFHAGYHRYHCDQRHPGAPGPADSMSSWRSTASRSSSRKPCKCETISSGPLDRPSSAPPAMSQA